MIDIPNLLNPVPNQADSSQDRSGTQTSMASSQLNPIIEISFFDDVSTCKGWVTRNDAQAFQLKNPVSSNQKLYEGYLFKRSKKTTLFYKKSYMVLYDNRLCQYSKISDKEEKRILFLHSVRLDLRPIPESELKKMAEHEKYYIILMTCKKQYMFWASDEQTKKEWILRLKKICILNDYSRFYSNIKVLGKGNFAKVLLSRNRSTHEDFAVKVTDKRQREQSGLNSKLSLFNEIEILKKCDHPNIIKLYEVYESANHIYMLQNLLKGGELFDSIMKKGNFDEKDAAKIIQQILLALEYIHGMGIMHRDLKPENLLLKDLEFNLVVADFGLASYIQGPIVYKRCGTPGYVAPEILYDQPYDTKVDIFSAGVILYILLTGCSPFYGKDYDDILRKNKACNINFNFKELNVRISEEALEILKLMLKRNPNERINAHEALRSRFIQKYCLSNENLKTTEEDEDFDEYKGSVYENMKNFQKDRFNVSNIKPKDLQMQTPLMNQFSKETPQKSLRSPLKKSPHYFQQDKLQQSIAVSPRKLPVTINQKQQNRPNMQINIFMMQPNQPGNQNTASNNSNGQVQCNSPDNQSIRYLQSLYKKQDKLETPTQNKKKNLNPENISDESPIPAIQNQSIQKKKNMFLQDIHRTTQPVGQNSQQINQPLNNFQPELKNELQKVSGVRNILQKYL